MLNSQEPANLKEENGHIYIYIFANGNVVLVAAASSLINYNSNCNTFSVMILSLLESSQLFVASF